MSISHPFITPKKLIEVALPLDAINAAAAKEKSIRHGHPSRLHLWWARRPLAAARAVIFSSLVDDPDSPDDAQTISRSRFIDLLRKELPAALKEMQSGNIAPVDLAQASIGLGMAIYSRYKAVLEPDGKPLSVRVALGLINQELDTYLSEQDGDIDGDTRFAISWFEQFGFN